MDCTLLACWSAEYTDAWLVVTDLPPEAAEVCWNGLRAWIEQGFKRIKSGGWHWQSTRMHEPARAERLWLAIALATWWLLSVGGESDATIAAETLAAVAKTQRGRRPRWRLLGIFHRGWTQLIAALLCHEPLSFGVGNPEPWPQMLPLTPGAAAAQPPPADKNVQL